MMRERPAQGGAPRRRGALLALFALLPLGALAAPTELAVCKRDRLVADGLLQRSRDRLLKAESAALAVQCAAWRDHVATVRQVAAIHGRCSPPPERDAVLAEMKESETGFAARIESRCKGL